MEEEQEINDSIELADLVKPRMENGLDVSLFTQKEFDLMNILKKEHEQLFRKRAEELRFYPDTLNRIEKSAILRCMNYEELKPYYRIVAIKEKNRRLQKMMAMDKAELRRYTRMTIQFSKSSCDEEKDLPDITIASNTEKYFTIMREREEIVYEAPYYFLSEAHKEEILKIYAKSVTENSIEVEPNVLLNLVEVKEGTHQ